MIKNLGPCDVFVIIDGVETKVDHVENIKITFTPDVDEAQPSNQIFTRKIPKIKES